MWLGIALVLAGTGPGIAPRPYVLRWDAPDTCPSAAEVDHALATALADAAASDEPPVRAEATIERDADGLHHLRLQLGRHEPLGERNLVATDCTELRDATVLLVTLAVDPSLAPTTPPLPPEPPVEPTPPVPAPEPVPEPVPAPAPAPSPAAQPDPPSSPAPADRPTPPPRRVHGGLLVAGGAGFGVAPSPDGMVELGLTSWGRGWRVELAGTYYTPAEATSPVNAAVGGRFQAWQVSPRACWLPPIPLVELPLCGGVGFGAVHGRGLGLEPARSPAAPWLSADLGVAVVWRWARLDDRLGLRLGGAVMPALTRPGFGTAQSGEIYRLGPVAGRVGAGLEVRLW